MVLLSIGGNDVGFGDVIQRCLLYSCLVFPFSGWKGDAQREAIEVEDRLVTTFLSVALAAKTAQVFAVGYPDPLAVRQCGATGWGATLLSIDQAEQAWLKQEFIGPLNESIRKAAVRAGIEFVPFEDAFVGNEICTSNAYTNGLKAGNDTSIHGRGPIGNESFHPNAMGHRKLFRVFNNTMAAVGFATDASYVPSTIPVTVGPQQPKLKVPAGPFGQSGPSLESSPGASFTLQGTGAPPATSGVIVFNSLPTNVGQWNSDAAGLWSADISIPYDAEHGLHQVTTIDSSTGRELGATTIDVDTTDSCRQSTSAPDADGDHMPDSCDISSTNGPHADVDGDGALNANDNCPALSNSDQADVNRNGFGDRCDPSLGADLLAALSDPVPAPTPGQPTNVSGSAGDSQATVSWSEPTPTAVCLSRAMSLLLHQALRHVRLPSCRVLCRAYRMARATRSQFVQ